MERGRRNVCLGHVREERSPKVVIADATRAVSRESDIHRGLRELPADLDATEEEAAIGAHGVERARSRGRHRSGDVMPDSVRRGPVPREAVEFLERKGVQPGFSYLDVWAEEHHRAFTAAKVMREDVLQAMQQEVTKALREGKPYHEFSRDLGQRLEQMGWWGKQNVRDPQTGEVAEVDVPSRLHRIYDTNMRTARAAGQWERIQRTKGTHPYLLYQLGPSKEHRPEHVAWHGLLLHVDDPFWREHFPPNGWGCKCWVRQVSRREAARLEKSGITAPNPEPIRDANGLPTGHVDQSRKVPVRTQSPKVRYAVFENKRRGVEERIPEGVDPGFHRPAGAMPPPAPAKTPEGRAVSVRIATPSTFSKAFDVAMSDEPRRHFVTRYSVSELRQMRALITDPTGRAGLAVKVHEDGRVEATALYNNGGAPGAGSDLLREAIAAYGVNYVECYSERPDRGLESLYASLGFVPITRDKFVDEYAPPGWDYEMHGRPDYVTMALPQGSRVEEIEE